MTICCSLNTTQAEQVPKTTRIIFVENSHMLLQCTESPFLSECHFLLSQDRNRAAEEKKTITSSWSLLLHPSALFCHARGRWLTHLSRWPKLWKTYRQNYFYRPWLCRCCHQLAGHLKYLNTWVQTALWGGLHCISWGETNFIQGNSTCQSLQSFPPGEHLNPLATTASGSRLSCLHVPWLCHVWLWLGW